jgi:site-specific DNA-methyltransferase (adenine-specific)
MQQTLFNEPIVNLISIDEAATSAKVSTATIRNWVKTGYLKIENKGFVRSDVLANFLDGRSGSKKLTGRANKSQKDFHDHEMLSADFKLLLSNVNSDLSALSDHYECSLSESFRNREGIYYTPKHVVENLFEFNQGDVSSLTFMDPCCGSGHFILRALDLGFSPENVYGYDTDPIAVELTKKRIFNKTGYVTKNVLHADFLAECLANKCKSFDVIYTNPPWGKKLDKEEKLKLGRAFSADGSVDTCSLFLFACLKQLKQRGELGFLLPDSFFNIATFESARLRSLSLQVTKLIDYDRPFKGLQTKAFGIGLKNTPVKQTGNIVLCKSQGNTFERLQSSFRKNPKSIINFQTEPAAATVIEHLFTVPHITLGGKAKWGLGIVTGNNEKFVKSTYSDDHVPVYRGADISNDGLAAPSCYIPSDLSLYQQVAPIQLYLAPVKLIYKFISSTLCFFCDTEQRFVLNSANMVIPHSSLTISAQQLSCLLNSEVINWMFSSIFKTHKILRADLESIPIHVEYFSENPDFSEESYLEYLSLERSSYGTYRIKKEDH